MRTRIDRSECSDYMWYNAKQRDKILCRQCTELGRTKNDCKLYTCDTCKEDKGRLHFKAKFIHNHKMERRATLECAKCEIVSAERVRRLQKALRQSKRVCNCFKPLHRRTCPLVPREIDNHGRYVQRMETLYTADTSITFIQESQRLFAV